MQEPKEREREREGEREREDPVTTANHHQHTQPAAHQPTANRGVSHPPTSKQRGRLVFVSYGSSLSVDDDDVELACASSLSSSSSSSSCSADAGGVSKNMLV